MYYPYFIAYMVIGFAISLLVFFWALEQRPVQRSGKGPVPPSGTRRENPRNLKISRTNRYEAYALGAPGPLGSRGHRRRASLRLLFVGGPSGGG